MDDKQFQTLLTELRGIHTALAAMGRAMKSEVPNYQRPLSAYRIFDWSSIGAVVLDNDAGGPTRVEYLGHHFTRRNGAGKFGEAIWFSRPQGKNEDGSNRYARLITFKDYSEAEELDGRIDPAPPRQTPSATHAPKTAAVPIPEKDWLQEAASCTDELFFDSAMVNAAPWFREATAVTTFRTTIFGEWNPATAAAQAVGMVEYANQREAGKQHATAKLEAMNRYNRKLEAERKAAPKDDKLGEALRGMRQNDGRIGLAKARAAHRATAN